MFSTVASVNGPAVRPGEFLGLVKRGAACSDVAVHQQKLRTRDERMCSRSSRRRAPSKSPTARRGARARRRGHRRTSLRWSARTRASACSQPLAETSTGRRRRLAGAATATMSPVASRRPARARCAIATSSESRPFGTRFRARAATRRCPHRHGRAAPSTATYCPQVQPLARTRRSPGVRRDTRAGWRARDRAGRANGLVGPVEADACAHAEVDVELGVAGGERPRLLVGRQRRRVRAHGLQHPESSLTVPSLAVRVQHEGLLDQTAQGTKGVAVRHVRRARPVRSRRRTPTRR